MSDIIRKPKGAPGSTGGQFDGRPRTAAGGVLTLEDFDSKEELLAAWEERNATTNPLAAKKAEAASEISLLLKSARLGGDRGREIVGKSYDSIQAALDAKFPLPVKGKYLAPENREALGMQADVLEAVAAEYKSLREKEYAEKKTYATPLYWKAGQIGMWATQTRSAADRND